MSKELTIGQVARLTDVQAKTIRYYEEVGVLPAPNRSDNGYRVYSETDVRRLELVRRARLLDMALPEVQELLEWAGRASCDEFQDRFLELVHSKLDEVSRRIADLHRLKQDLERLDAHFRGTRKEVVADHTVLECSPETCTCLGNVAENKQ